MGGSRVRGDTVFDRAYLDESIIGVKVIDNMLNKAFTRKLPINHGNFCDLKHHPLYEPSYRLYRRGNNRCSQCGCKIGRPKIKLTTLQNETINNIFHSNPAIRILMYKYER